MNEATASAFPILDNNQVLADIMGRSLTRCGFSVTVAHDDRAALAVASIDHLQIRHY